MTFVKFLKMHFKQSTEDCFYNYKNTEKHKISMLIIKKHYAQSKYSKQNATNKKPQTDITSSFELEKQTS